MNKKPALQPLLAICIGMVLLSCNNSTEATKEEPKKTADSTAAAAAPVADAFQPFDVMEISHTVKDYSKWRPAFDADAVNRKANGMEDIVVGRGIDNPNNVLIAVKAADLEKAKSFSADPKLKETMQKAGVVSKPGFQLFHLIRFNPDAKEKQWVIITHRVKDFDAWLKAFDEEGKTQRASEGMVDAALGRGVDDPNIVHIVLDITDMSKAKAALVSDAKKKLMMSAGVEGKPVIEFYQTAE